MTNGPMPFAFGVSQFTTQPWSFDHDVARYGALGVETIEIVETKLDPARIPEQMATVAAAGLRIGSIQATVRTFLDSRMMPEPQGVDARIDALRGSIERLAPCAPGATFVINTGAHPKGDVQEAITITSRALKTLAPVAADHDVRLAIEPLSPASANVESAIWTIEQALTIVEQAGHDAVGLCLDFWNSWQDADVAGWIGRAGDRIFTLQVADWRSPRSFADRLVPGDGVIPLGPLLHATYRAGFRGACIVELFSNDVDDSLYRGSLDALIVGSRDALEKAWFTG